PAGHILVSRTRNHPAHEDQRAGCQDDPPMPTTNSWRGSHRTVDIGQQSRRSAGGYQMGAYTCPPGDQLSGGAGLGAGGAGGNRSTRICELDAKMARPCRPPIAEGSCTVRWISSNKAVGAPSDTIWVRSCSHRMDSSAAALGSVRVVSRYTDRMGPSCSSAD